MNRLALAMVALSSLAMSLMPGCGKAPAPAPAGLKVGLICSGSTSDGGWNQSAREALEKISQSRPLAISVLEKVSPDRAGDEMRDYVSRGYDLVIGHGYEFLVPAAEVARKDAKTHFAVSGADRDSLNVTTIYFDLSKASYQMGVLAAKVSQSGKLGFIGGAAIPAVKACYQGFLAGAKSVKAEISVAESYTGWDQPEKAKSQAEAFIQQNIDVIYQNVDAASRGIFEAVRDANLARPEVKIWAMGCNSDQNANPICREFTLASAVIRMDRAFEILIDGVSKKTLKPGLFTGNDENNICVMALNPKIPENVVFNKPLDLIIKTRKP